MEAQGQNSACLSPSRARAMVADVAGMPGCQRRILAERLSKVCAPHAQQAKRTDEIIATVACPRRTSQPTLDVKARNTDQRRYAERRQVRPSSMANTIYAAFRSLRKFKLVPIFPSYVRSLKLFSRISRSFSTVET
jgi:hypothetical protein